MTFDATTEAWELDDALLSRRPRFFAPTAVDLAELMQLQAGDRVQLRLSFRGLDRHGPFLQIERHWVLVCQVAGEQGTGILDTDPGCSRLLRAGDRVDFETRHIAAIRRAVR
ncbi:MAG: hypothetical protein JSR82_16210 [Verrucomicrobia bacterium]|nr:hypothetical protein [Verrucomicrobiota bacterium]